jgi:mannose-1-phosphate guanylyltransferase
MSRWGVVLAGGVGSRFWPLSTPRRPKQLLPLVSESPLLVDSVRRLEPLVGRDRILIVTNGALVDPIAELLPDIARSQLLAEPRSAGTAPALVWAAREIAARDGNAATMLSIHADWAVADGEGFRRTLARAAEVAEARHVLVTVGVVPSRPDPGFGYIQPGEAVDGARKVARFVEKPDRARAQQMVGEGYLWNSGIFVWRVGDFLREVRAHAREVTPALPALERGDVAAFFAGVTAISVDHAVLERSGSVLVLPGDFGWDDVGTWAALQRVRARDDAGNALAGAVHAVAARDNVVHAEGGSVVLYGVNELVVVSRPGLTLVTTLDRAADLKTMLDALPSAVRDRE